MLRTQISLQPEQMEAARREARRRGISIAELIRQALDSFLADEDHQRRREQALAAVGGFHSGHADTSVNHDEVLAEGSEW